MEVPLVILARRLLRLRIAANDIRDADVDVAAVVRVADELVSDSVFGFGFPPDITML